jgi:Na+/H+ antiporter NhaD/arsenite permease-like protein
VLANLIGTTGASMLLIRPVLRINQGRLYKRHVPVFFIFMVSNLGGLLTPLGDPPLYIGFLRGVDFFWTLQLWPQWLLANGMVLGAFFLWDALAYWTSEPRSGRAKAANPGSYAATLSDAYAPTRSIFHATERFRVRGLVNVLLLAGILAAILLRSEEFALGVRAWLNQFFLCPDLQVVFPWGGVMVASMALLSVLLTPRTLRQANAFDWGPIIEVAVLFAGIFIAMIPALDLVAVHGQQFNLSEPRQFFWLAGSLSSFLDNAPTYLTFTTLAAGSTDISKLVQNQVPGLDGPAILAAVSCGAVFMGAMTYIGNGPNFMVKAIAEENGYPMPSFIGYLVYSCLLLLPTFAVVTAVFFGR